LEIIDVGCNLKQF